MHFIYVIKPNKENFIETMTEEESNIMSEHAAYLKKLLEKDILVLAGPTLNAKFGIVIIQTDNEEQAKSIMINDPAVAKKVMSSQLFPFKVSFLKK